MKTEKRQRGRPIGTGLDDSPELSALADVLLEFPNLKPTTAMRKILLRPSEAAVRRLQSKWKKQREGLLDEAEQRLAARPAKLHQTHCLTVHSAQNRGDPLQAVRMPEYTRVGHAALIADSPAMRAVRQFGGLAKRYQNVAEASSFENLAVNRAIAQNSAVKRAITQMSVSTRANLQIQESAAMRAFREYENSPVMQLVRQQRDMLKRIYPKIW